MSITLSILLVFSAAMNLVTIRGIAIHKQAIRELRTQAVERGCPTKHESTCCNTATYTRNHEREP